MAKGIAIFSFCSPSRGPTSTSRTLLLAAGCCELAVAKPRRSGTRHRQQVLQTADRSRLMLNDREVEGKEM